MACSEVMTDRTDALESTLDWNAALEAMGGDPELLRSVTQILIDEAPRQVVSIRAAIAKNSAKDLRRVAHTLKSSLRYFGASSASALAEQLEQLGQAGRTDASVESLEKLESAVASVVRALLDYLRQNSAHSA